MTRVRLTGAYLDNSAVGKSHKTSRINTLAILPRHVEVPMNTTRNDIRSASDEKQKKKDPC